MSMIILWTTQDSIDVSSLIDGSSSTQYKEALIKLKHEDIPCMTYKLKVRLE